MDAGMMEALSRSGGASGTVELPSPLVRAGRALLGWSRLDLAKAAGLSVSSLLRIEAGDTGRAGSAGVANAKVRKALEAAGIRFADTGRGGLRLCMGADELEVGDRAPRISG